MEWTQIVTALISAASAIIVGYLARKYQKDSDENNKKAERRKKESLLSMKMLEASLELALVEAEAMTNGHLNGNVEQAKQKAQEAKSEYEAYAKQVMLEELASN